MSKEYWDRLHGLYHDVQNGQPQVRYGEPPMHGGQMDEAGVQHLEEGGYVEPEQNQSAYQQMPYSPQAGSQAGEGKSPWWMEAAKGFAGNLIPAAGAAATGLMIDRMFPGKTGKVTAQDMRQPEMQKGAVTAQGQIDQNIANPNSFGLPGDPNDVNTPAGQRMYQLKKNYRSASAAGGRLETGGSMAGEADMVNKAIGDQYQATNNSGFQHLTSMTPQLQRMETPAEVNPFAKILTSALAPGVHSGLKAGTNAGLKAITDKWFT